MTRPWQDVKPGSAPSTCAHVALLLILSQIPTGHLHNLLFCYHLVLVILTFSAELVSREPSLTANQASAATADVQPQSKETKVTLYMHASCVLDSSAALLAQSFHMQACQLQWLLQMHESS